MAASVDSSSSKVGLVDSGAGSVDSRVVASAVLADSRVAASVGLAASVGSRVDLVDSSSSSRAGAPAGRAAHVIRRAELAARARPVIREAPVQLIRPERNVRRAEPASHPAAHVGRTRLASNMRPRQE